MASARYSRVLARTGKVWRLGLVAAALLVSAANARAQEQVIRVLLDSSFDLAGQRFIQQVQKLLPPEAAKNVRFEIQRTVASSLSPRLRSNDWEMAILASTAITREGIGTTAAAFELPYAFPNLKSVLELQRSPLGHAGLGGISDIGMTGFVYLNDGSTLFASRIEPKSLADLKGRKVAISSNVHLQAFEKIGSSPVNFGKSEIANALERGTVDAAEFNPSSDDLAVFSKGNFLLTDKIQARVAIVATRDGVWDKVPFVYRAMIGDAAIAATRQLDQSLIETEEKMLAQVTSTGVSLVAFGSESTARATRQWIREQPEAVQRIYSTAYDQMRSVTQNLAKPPTSPGRGGAAGRFYFATTRDDTGDSKVSYRFGDSRTNVLKCGQVEYTTSSPTQESAIFVGQIIADNGQCSSYLDRVAQPNKKLLIFVHGFNNRFSEASERAMALKTAAGDDVEVLLWSWPSKRDGAFGDYKYDKESVGGITLYNFQQLLRSLKAASERTSIDLLAHSMGGWHTLNALLALSGNQDRPRLRNLIFAAPDVPSNDFALALEALSLLTGQITLYACKWDWALSISTDMNSYARAGTGGDADILVDRKLDSIDVDGRWLSTNHSYVFEAGNVLSDLNKIVALGSSIDVRGLQKTPKTTHYYWKFP